MNTIDLNPTERYARNYWRAAQAARRHTERGNHAMALVWSRSARDWYSRLSAFIKGGNDLPPAA